MLIEPGTRLGRYEIRSKIGQGGMGEVYLAEDTTLRRSVAIKVIPVEAMSNEQANKRFLREAQTAAKLDHPNICAVHEVAEDNGRSFIVMQYVEGDTLDVRIKQKPLSVSESINIAFELASALCEAHDHNIIHRDIKPSNIMITKRNQVKVMDFGLARLSQPSALASEVKIDGEASTQAFLTTPGTLIGTVPYMSTEQVHGQSLDARTDIFSFGVVFYEMLTGQHPFTAESPAGLISAILTREPSPISDHISNCPAELQRIVGKCLAKDRAHRYQTMRDVCTDLENVRSECESVFHKHRVEPKLPRQSNTTVSDSLIEHRSFKHRRISPVFATLLLGVVATVVYFQFFRTRTSPTATLKTSPSVAYDTYLQAKVLSRNETKQNTEDAIKLLEGAVASDPNFALAWCELARAYYIKAFYYSPEEAQQLNLRAQFANEKALYIDQNLAEAHFVRGLLLWSHANHFLHEEAIQSYKRALTLNPNLDEAHHQLGLVYLHIGLLDKAWSEIEKAVNINPSNTLARFRFGVISLYRGQYEEALRFFKSTPQKNPSVSAFQTAHTLFHLGRSDEALSLIDQYLHDYPKDEGGVGNSVRAMIFAKAGKTREAEDAIQRAETIGRNFGHFHHTAYNIACAYALMNKPEQALHWLEVAADDGFPCYPLFAGDKSLNNLRNDKTFLDFMAKLKEKWQRYASL